MPYELGVWTVPPPYARFRLLTNIAGFNRRPIKVCAGRIFFIDWQWRGLTSVIFADGKNGNIVFSINRDEK